MRPPNFFGTLFGLLLLILILKLGYLFAYKNNIPYYDFPTGDSKVYLEKGNEIANVNWLGNRVFHRAPFYPYLIALFFKVFSKNLLPIYLFQILLGIINLLLIFLIGQRIFNRQVGYLTLLLSALYPTFTFFESKILGITLLIFFSLLGTYLLLRSQKNLTRLFAGIVFGLATITWSGFLLVVFFLIIFNLRKSLFLMTGIFIMIFPITLRNYLVGKDFVLINSNGGFTFYQGNNLASSGLLSQPPEIFQISARGDFLVEIGEQEQFEIEYAELATHKKLKPSQVSNFWFKKGIEFLKKNPLDGMRLLFRKFIWTISSYEPPLSYDFQVEKRFVPILKLLFVPLGLLLALAYFGFRTNVGQGKNATLKESKLNAIRLFYPHLLGTLFALLIFFSSSRYRLPAVPYLTILAGAGLYELFKSGLKGIRAKQVLPLLFIFGISTFLLPYLTKKESNSLTAVGYFNLGLGLIEGEYRHIPKERVLSEALELLPQSDYYKYYKYRLHILLGSAYLKEHNYEKALEQYRLAKEFPFTPARSQFLLGVNYFLLNRLDSAEVYFKRVLEMNPDKNMASGVFAYLGTISRNRSDFRSAIEQYQKGLELDSLNIGNYVELGITYSLVKDYPQAIAILKKGIYHFPKNFILHYNLAIVYLEAKEYRNALEAAQIASNLEPKNQAVKGLIQQIISVGKSHE